MRSQYHIEILQASLGKCFSERALATMIHANLNQDRLTAQLGHDEFHFDNNAFEKSYAYIEEQRTLTIAMLQKKDAPSAWRAFGRLSHTIQDFYAHSNYITMWIALYDGKPLPSPPEVDPMDPSLLNSPDLHSGKLYYPLEVLSFIPSTKQFALKRLPKDSHAWMNLDSPEQGFKFDYAMQAAIKRTVIEFEKTTEVLSQELCQLFLDR